MVATASPTSIGPCSMASFSIGLAADALDGAGHAGAHPQLGVGGVGDGVHLELGDVAGGDLELGLADRRLHGPPGCVGARGRRVAAIIPGGRLSRLDRPGRLRAIDSRQSPGSRHEHLLHLDRRRLRHDRALGARRDRQQAGPRVRRTRWPSTSSCASSPSSACCCITVPLTVLHLWTTASASTPRPPAGSRSRPWRTWLIAFTAYYYALRGGRVAVVAPISSTDPLWTALFAWLIVGTAFGALTLAGMAVAMAGVRAHLALDGRRRRAPAAGALAGAAHGDVLPGPAARGQRPAALQAGRAAARRARRARRRRLGPRPGARRPRRPRPTASRRRR